MRVCAIIVLGLVLALPAGGAQPRRATLELRSTAPLVVSGSGFGAREHVVVVAALPGKQRIVNAVARPNGRFTARFELRLKRCTPLAVRAIGRLGSRAILHVEHDCDDDD
jgi:hypothetical protein